MRGRGGVSKADGRCFLTVFYVWLVLCFKWEKCEHTGYPMVTQWESSLCVCLCMCPHCEINLAQLIGLRLKMRQGHSWAHPSFILSSPSSLLSVDLLPCTHFLLPFCFVRTKHVDVCVCVCDRYIHKVFTNDLFRERRSSSLTLMYQLTCVCDCGRSLCRVTHRVLIGPRSVEQLNYSS